VDAKKNKIFFKNYWNENFPSLHIEDSYFLNAHQNFDVNDKFGEALREIILEEGYFKIDPPNWNLNIIDMASAASKMAEMNLPIPLVFLFDEFWIIFLKLHNIAEAVLGKGYLRLPDFWGWHVDPQKKQSGWTPHRDKGYKSLNADGTPKSITFWIPLSASTPLNGCMYIVPANKDKNYGTPQDSQLNFDLPSIRALPAAAGSILCWNQAVLHWGSQCSERELQPRISVAFEFQSGDVAPYNQPIMDPRSIPTFEFRLKLIAKQILQYQHMYPLSQELRQLAITVLDGAYLESGNITE
jgi:hypothetical protein